MVSLSRPDSHAPLPRRLTSTARPVLLHLPGPAGTDSGVDERMEVSGTVLMTWAAKTAGLCAAEDLEDGARVLLDLPLHWMSLAVGLGLLCAGAEPVFPDATGAGPDDVDAVVAGEADAPVPPGALGLRLALPRALAPVREHPQPVSAADVDMAAALLGEADRLTREPTLPAAASLADLSAGHEDVLRLPRAVVLAHGPLRAHHLAAALQAWEGGEAVVVGAGDLASAARAAGYAC